MRHRRVRTRAGFVVLLTASMAAGCRTESPERTMAEVAEGAQAPVRSDEMGRAATAGVTRLTQGQDTPVAGHRLGVMWLKASEGDAVRARVSVYESTTGHEREVTLREGDTIDLGDRTYRVSALRLGATSGERGFVEIVPLP